ncbi:MAG: hypothetical protein K0S33_2999 [Bacteroidetes bacterium]|jgi:hypothetical protein|nr:hypothetical protein [Bacteroidota bacterium]
MKKQTTKKTAPKKAAAKKSRPGVAKKTAAPASGKTASKKPASKPAAKPEKKQNKVDEKLIHQIDWLTQDVVNGYFSGVDSDILSKSDIKELIKTTNNHQEIFDYLSVEKQTSADFAEFMLFYMHTIAFTGAADAIYKEWKEDYKKAGKKKKK